MDRALRAGRPRHARAARRQGRERRGDDARAGRRSACRRASRSRRRRASAYMRADRRSSPTASRSEVAAALAALEERAGKRLGDADDPLLVSVRSGARESMPGMMDTVLNLGLNDASVEGLAARTDNPRFAWDAYRRFVQMFGNVCRGIPGERFEAAIAARKRDGRRERRRRAGGGRPARAGRRRSRRSIAERDRRGRSRRTRPMQLRAGDPRRVRLVARQARRDVPADQPHPRRVGHGLQRPADGVRQQGRHVVLGRRVLARRGDGRAGAVGRLPRQRPGRGRRVRRAHAARPRARWPT